LTNISSSTESTLSDHTVS